MLSGEDVIETDVKEWSDGEGADLADGGWGVAEAEGEGEDGLEGGIDGGRLCLDGSHRARGILESEECLSRVI